MWKGQIFAQNTVFLVTWMSPVPGPFFLHDKWLRYLSVGLLKWRWLFQASKWGLCFTKHLQGTGYNNFSAGESAHCSSAAAWLWAWGIKEVLQLASSTSCATFSPITPPPWLWQNTSFWKSDQVKVLPHISKWHMVSLSKITKEH